MATDNTIQDIIIRNMIRLREAKGWNKSELARATGVDASHISNIEKGKKRIGLEVIEKLAFALDVEPYQMLREYDPLRMNLGEKLELIEQLPEIKRIAIEQMVNAFLKESQT